MSNDTPTIFTIGHSTHSLEEFLALLNRHGITAIADVRSQPYGRLDHFNRENLSAALQAAGIEYVFLGQQLGARRQEPECYENGVALYERIVKTARFPRRTRAIAPGGEEVQFGNHVCRKGTAGLPPGHPHRSLSEGFRDSRRAYFGGRDS